MSDRKTLWWGLWLCAFVAYPLLLTAMLYQLTGPRSHWLADRPKPPRRMPSPAVAPEPLPVVARTPESPRYETPIPVIIFPAASEEPVLERPAAVVASMEIVNLPKLVAVRMNEVAHPAEEAQYADPEQGKIEEPAAPVASEVALPPVPPQPEPAAALQAGPIGPTASRGVCCTPSRCASLARQAADSHKTLYFENDFDYLCDPCYDGHLLGDALKRNGVGCQTVVDVGGEYRLRYQNERNMRGMGLTGLDDSFLLHRTRLYANAEHGPFRVYAEMLDALSTYEQYPPRATEEDRTQLHNLFADVRLTHGLSARLGRQELLYGAQRTVSPLDWANTRRTFEGYKAFWQGEDWDVDGFWTRPVPPQPGRFDTPDQSQQFMGLYATCRQSAAETLDLYYLRLVETDAATNFDFHTLGTRWAGSRGPWRAEIEAAVQFGSYGAESHSAGAYTLGLGRTLDRLPWNATLWAYYDWASGDATIGNGYHHLFPLSHKYLGWMDFYGRRNIEDLNFLLTLQPRDRLQLMLWWHIFHRQNPADVPYNVNMSPFVTTPGGSGQLGQELDLAAVWTVTPRTELMLGYSHFFTGAFYRTNPTPTPFSGDADFFYTQLNVQF